MSATASVLVPATAGSPAAARTPSRRAWERFRRNRLGYGSLWSFVMLLVVLVATGNG